MLVVQRGMVHPYSVCGVASSLAYSIQGAYGICMPIFMHAYLYAHSSMAEVVDQLANCVGTGSRRPSSPPIRCRKEGLMLQPASCNERSHRHTTQCLILARQTEGGVGVGGGGSYWCVRSLCPSLRGGGLVYPWVTRMPQSLSEKFERVLQILDGCGEVFVLQRADGILAEPEGECRAASR